MKNSPLNETLSSLIDLIFAGILWSICSLPLISAGPASAALYYSIVKCVRRDRGRLLPVFFGALKSNFKDSLYLWLLFLLYVSVGAADAWAFSRMGVEEGSVLYFISRIYFVPGLLMLPWVFPYVSRFKNGLKDSVYFVAYLTVSKFWRTALLSLLLWGGALVCYLVPMLLPFIAGPVCLLSSLVIEPVFKEITSSQDSGEGDKWYNE